MKFVPKIEEGGNSRLYNRCVSWYNHQIRNQKALVDIIEESPLLIANLIYKGTFRFSNKSWEFN